MTLHASLGSYDGGHMLFLGLGTGLGSAMIVDGFLHPWNSRTCCTKKGKLRGLSRHPDSNASARKWRRHVAKVVERLKRPSPRTTSSSAAGNSKKLDTLPLAPAGQNENAYTGGSASGKE